MDEIPTPRCNKHESLMETEDFDVELAQTKTLARQLERELTIAKQALERISFGVRPTPKRGGCAQIELSKLDMQEIADAALTSICEVSK